MREDRDQAFMFSKLHTHLNNFFLLQETKKKKGLRSYKCDPKNDCDINCSELEPRVLYSAVPLDLSSVEPDINTEFDSQSVEHTFVETQDFDWSEQADESFVQLSVLEDLLAADNLLGNDLLSNDLFSSETDSIQEILFVTEDVQDYQSLIDSISWDVNRNVEIVVLSSEQNGIEAITNTLANFTDLQSVHFITHGSDGELQFGNTKLNSDSLEVYRDQISGWASSLSADADLLFYGCELTQTQVGLDFVDALAELTDADVAASSDLSGHESLGGDWDLEYVHGELSSDIILSSAIQASWHHTLAVQVTGGDAALWFGTEDNGSSNGGLSWTTSEVVQLGDPGVQLEPDFATSAGNFELTGFHPTGEIRAMHVVNSDSVFVGDTAVRRGDVLFSVKANHTFAGGVFADRQDIMLFRPTVANDYSAGTYSMFLDEAVHDGSNSFNIHAITLVEKETVVGGITLGAGTILASHSGGSEHDNIYGVLVNTTSFGATSTTDTDAKILFLEGSGSTNLDFDDAKITGLELLEDDAVIGGTTLSQGSIWVTLDSNETVGGNGVSVGPHDVFSLNVTETEVTGQTTANATLLFEGNDVGLSTNDERFQGISLVNSVESESLIAQPDAYNAIEDSVLTVNGSEGVWANDDLLIQDIVQGATLDYQGHIGNQGATWNDASNQSGYNLPIGANVFTSPVDNTPGIVSALTFDGTGEVISPDSFNSLPGFPVFDDATLEFWVRPSDAVGKELIFETGGIGGFNTGVSLELDGTELKLYYYAGNSFQVTTADISAQLANPSNPFIQIAVQLEFVTNDGSGTNNDVKADLYVDGNLESGFIFNNSLYWSFDAGDAFALGGAENSFYVDGGAVNAFEGEIGAFRFYESLLSNAQIQSNYDAITQLFVTDFDALSASGASVDVNADGSFTYDSGNIFNYLAAGETATDTFSYEVQSSAGATDSTVVEITITGTDDLMSSTDILDLSTNEDVAFSLDVSGNFVDIDDELNYTAVLAGPNSLPAWLTLDPLTGVFSGTPTNSDVGAITIEVTADNGSGDTATETFVLTVNNVNDAPVITQNQLTVNAGGTVVLTGADFAANDVDDPNANLTFSVSNIVGGHFALATSPAVPLTSFTQGQVAAEEIVFVDNGDQFAPSFDLSVTDAALVTDGPDATTITFVNPNDAPVMVDQNFSVNEDSAVGTIVGTVVANDSDSGAQGQLTYSITGGTGSTAFSINSAGEITVADASQLTLATGPPLTLNVLVTDGGSPPLSDAATITIVINEVNDAPTITTASFNVDEFETLIGNVLVSDEDVGDSHNWQIAGGADAGLFGINSGSGQLSFISPQNFESAADFNLDGIYEVIVVATDSGSATATQLIQVTVDNANDTPEITSTGFNVSELNTVVGSVVVSDEDALDTHTYQIAGGADGSLLGIDSITGQLSFLAPVDFENPADADGNGVYEVTIRATDNLGATSARTVLVTVDNANEIPTTSGLGDLTVNEDSGEVVIDLNTAFADPEDLDSDLSYTVSTGNPGLFTSAVVDGAGQLRMSLAPNQFGLSLVTVVATDLDGSSVSTTFQIDVLPVNDEESLDVNATLNVVEGNSVVLSAAVLSTSDIESASSSLTYRVVSDADFGWITIDNLAADTFTQQDIDNGRVRFHHDGSEQATDSLQFEVDDNEGTATRATLNIFVTPVNDAPVANDDNYQVDADGTLSGSLTANDTDVDSPALAATLDEAPANGAVVVNPDGSFVYTPNEGFQGVDTFTYLVSDGEFDENATVVVTVFQAVLPPAVTATESAEAEAESESEEEESEKGAVPTSLSQKRPVEEVVTSQRSQFEGKGVAFGQDKESEQVEAEMAQVKDANELYSALTGLGAGSAQEVSRLMATIEDLDERFMDKSGWFWQALNANDERMALEASLPNVLFQSSAALASGVTVGYLVWLIKGGQVMAAVVANLPAWRLIDPLPILNAMIADQDDESLETIIEKGEDVLEQPS
ncbi:MAG: DUF4347 domain-containing protein [Mariniblastus sp.]